MQQSRSGDDEVKHLRDIASKTSDPTDAKALKTFADELGGALWRQQKIARDLNGYLAYVDFHDMSQWSEADQNMNRAVFGVSDPMAEIPSDFQIHTPQGQTWPSMKPHLGHDPSDPTATDYAKRAANDFLKQIPDIVIDENHAASHVDGALGKC